MGNRIVEEKERREQGGEREREGIIFDGSEVVEDDYT